MLSIGLFAVVLHYACIYLGLKSAASAKTALLKQGGVLIYVCFSSFIFPDDRPTPRKLVGALLLGESIGRLQYLMAFLLIAGGVCIATNVSLIRKERTS